MLDRGVVELSDVRDTPMLVIYDAAAGQFRASLRAELRLSPARRQRLSFAARLPRLSLSQVGDLAAGARNQ